MSFVSAGFIGFLAASVLLYYIVPRRLRWVALLAASYVFYLSGGLKTVGFLLLATLSTWGAGLLLHRQNLLRRDADKAALAAIKRRKKWIVAAALLINLGMLFVLKYLSFTETAIAAILGKLGISWLPKQPELLLPLGVSFFVFQSVGYVIDQYRGKYEAQKNPLKYALFTSFFPQMVQGPISRYNELSEQLYAGSAFRAENLRSGIQLMLWGYLKKMVIADRAAVLVNSFFGSMDSYGGAVTAFSILLYCIELYCDFSGGIDIARGAAELFGIRLAENFRRPIFATSLADYWRRWHITLGSWMRDYVFYPLSLSKPFGRLNKWARRRIGGKLGKIFATSLATFVVYLLIGLWHGGNFRYIAFGFWNGALITASLLLSNVFHVLREKLHIRAESPAWQLFSMARTAFLVFIGRYITRAPRLLSALRLLRRTFTDFRFGELTGGTVLQMGLPGKDLIVIAVCTLVLLLVEIHQERHGSMRDTLSKKSGFVQWLAMVIPMAAILFLGILRGSYIASEFIYRQF